MLLSPFSFIECSLSPCKVYVGFKVDTIKLKYCEKFSMNILINFKYVHAEDKDITYVTLQVLTCLIEPTNKPTG